MELQKQGAKLKAEPADLNRPASENTPRNGAGHDLGLTPEQWLSRLRTVWPETASLVVEGTESMSGEQLLAELSRRFESFDQFLGKCPVTLNYGFVAEARCLLGSLKKFRRSMQDPTLLANAAVERFIRNNACARSNKVPARFVAGMREFLSIALRSYENMSAIPHFGPGAVAERISIVDRWEAVGLDGCDRLVDYSFRDPLQILPPPDAKSVSWHGGVYHPSPCRLCAVPKDWNKKRLITVEPWSLSYLQHCCRESLLRALRKAPTRDLQCLARPEKSDPQLRHRRLAQRGSMDGSLATLDMSDASDMVSMYQVQQVFPAAVLADLERARSTEYVRPEAGAEPEPLYMYGGMGNATTFVVETLMFHAACYAIARYHRIRNPRISCFGDDTIVSGELAQLIVDLGLFDEFGWRLNTAKSFYTVHSRFRESCGGQFYNGHDVTLLRYHGYDNGPTGRKAVVDLVHRCCENPRWVEVVASPWEELEGYIPNSPERSALGALITSVPWWPDTASQLATRYNRETQQLELRAPSVMVPSVVVRVTGLGPVYGALAGQLGEMTGTRRIRGRKVLGVVVAQPKRARLSAKWLVATPETWSF